MASFTPGGSLASITYEGALIEIAQTLQNMEILEETRPNNVTVDYFTGDNTALIVVDVPIEKEVDDSSGRSEYFGLSYMVEEDFLTGSSLKSESWSGALVEILTRIEKLQLLSTLTPGVERITTNLVSGETGPRLQSRMELPINFGVDGTGKVLISAVPFITPNTIL
jgi:hypothetical protein